MPNAAAPARHELRAAYAPALLNPDTGWVAGWRSRDGALHDYAFTWINGPALSFGLLDAPLARQAMANLEALRDSLGLRDFRLGLPANFLPMREEDHQLPASADRIADLRNVHRWRLHGLFLSLLPARPLPVRRCRARPPTR